MGKSKLEVIASEGKTRNSAVKNLMEALPSGAEYSKINVKEKSGTYTASCSYKSGKDKVVKRGVGYYRSALEATFR